MGRIIRQIDVRGVSTEDEIINYGMDISELLKEIDIDDIIKHHTKDTLLHKMGYDEDLCFETDVDLKEAVEENPEAYNIELKTKLDSMNDQDIYDRFTTLLYTNKLTHQQWDEMLSKYE